MFIDFVIFIVLFKCLLTVSGLAKVAIFSTNVDAENQTLINHKCVCGALNRHFFQTRVMPSFFFLGRCLSVHCRVVGSSFAVFCLPLCVWKNCKCATKFVGYYSSLFIIPPSDFIIAGIIPFVLNSSKLIKGSFMSLQDHPPPCSSSIFFHFSISSKCTSIYFS
jgi:hypothetical protein